METIETIYEWTILGVESIKSTLNVTTSVHWRLTASHHNKFAEICSITALPETTGETLAPYAKLVKEQIVDWLVLILGEKPEAVDGIEQQSELDKIKEILNTDIEFQLTQQTA